MKCCYTLTALSARITIRAIPGDAAFPSFPIGKTLSPQPLYNELMVT